jgi:farnesyl diphosphate synthase
MASATAPPPVSNGAKPSTDKAARRKRFEDVFPIIADELLTYVKGEGMPKDAVEWYEKVSAP